MSDQSTMRRLPGRAGGDGSTVYTTALTPEHRKGPVHLFHDSRRVIPVIVIPGILATRLRSTKREKKIVWDPPNSTWDGIKALFDCLFKSTEERVEELNPENTVVEYGLPPDSDIAEKDPQSAGSRETRGWGALYASKYHPLMEYIEDTLNAFRGTKLPEVFRTDPREYGALRAGLSLEDEEYRAATGGYRYEVWGGGYNWLWSNEVSAKTVWDFVTDKVLPYYPDTILNEGKKVILVAHSMGGLVSRAICRQHGARILGVIHLAQPASGAPAVYKRMRAGYEGLEQVVLGRNAGDVSGILGRAQGGLELLPFANYDGEMPWFHCPKETGRESDILSLPMPRKSGPDPYPRKSGPDPYTDIYKAREWYGLLPDHNLRYISKIISAVQKFHESIADVYHPCTCAVWGEGRDRKAWRRISWEPRRRRTLHDPVLRDDGNGSVSHGSYAYSLEMEDCPGDATVPHVSARDQLRAAAVSFLHGSTFGAENRDGVWEHQACCCDGRVHWATVYSIIRIVSSAKEKGEL